MTVISVVSDDIPSAFYQKDKIAINQIDKENYEELEGSFEDILDSSFENTSSQTILDILGRLPSDSSIIIYDHTKPEFNIPVVHVMIPGFQLIHSVSLVV